MKTLVTLFAHPDDESFGNGGTLWLLKDHYRIIFLCLTRGERGLSPGYREVRHETGILREKELRNAAKLVNAEVRFLDCIDVEVYASRDLCQKVAGLLKEIRPDLFISMWPIDAHPDHTATSEIARKAIALSSYEGEFWMAEEGIWQTSQFEPDFYVDISDVVAGKNQLIRCHACQNTDDKIVMETEKLNRFRGAKAGCHSAEGFKSLTGIRTGRETLLSKLPKKDLPHG